MAAQDDGGGAAISVGPVAQLPITIRTCTPADHPRFQSVPRFHAKVCTVASCRPGKAARLLHGGRQTSSCAAPEAHGQDHHHWATASLTPTQRSAVGEHTAGQIHARCDLCEGVAARDEGGGPAISVGPIAQLPITIITCTQPRFAVSATMCAVSSCRPGRAAHAFCTAAGKHTALRRQNLT